MALWKKDIADAIRLDLNISNSESVLVTESILKTIKETLASGDEVLVSRFGKFQVNQKSERLGRNPYTGEPMMLPPHRVVTFKASCMLRDRLNGGNRYG
jgi:integration host factor subunit alpha